MNGIITIGREYGSGGRLIARRAADRLGVPFYDKMLIAMVAKKGGYALEYVEETGEYSTTSSLLFGMSLGATPYAPIMPEEALSPADKVQIMQNQVIREIAEKGPCVIVGRCADYILRERGDCLNIFFHADLEHKHERAVNYFNIEPEDVKKELKKKDKARAAHYRHYTDGRDWGAASNYHLTIDSGRFGVEGSVDLLVDAAERLLK